jgi:hypothetical protein
VAQLMLLILLWTGLRRYNKVLASQILGICWYTNEHDRDSESQKSQAFKWMYATLTILILVG